MTVASEARNHSWLFFLVQTVWGEDGVIHPVQKCRLQVDANRELLRRPTEHQGEKEHHGVVPRLHSDWNPRRGKQIRCGRSRSSGTIRGNDWSYFFLFITWLYKIFYIFGAISKLFVSLPTYFDFDCIVVRTPRKESSLNSSPQFYTSTWWGFNTTPSQTPLSSSTTGKAFSGLSLRIDLDHMYP